MSQSFVLSDQPNYGNWSIQVDAYVSFIYLYHYCIVLTCDWENLDNIKVIISY